MSAISFDGKLDVLVESGPLSAHAHFEGLSKVTMNGETAALVYHKGRNNHNIYAVVWSAADRFEGDGVFTERLFIGDTNRDDNAEDNKRKIRDGLNTYICMFVALRDAIQ